MSNKFPVLTLVTDCWHTCIDIGDWLLTYLYWHWWLILLTYLYWHWWLTVDISVFGTCIYDCWYTCIGTGDYDCWYTWIGTGDWLLTYLYWHLWLWLFSPLMKLYCYIFLSEVGQCYTLQTKLPPTCTNPLPSTKVIFCYKLQSNNRLQTKHHILNYKYSGK